MQVISQNSKIKFASLNNDILRYTPAVCTYSNKAFLKEQTSILGDRQARPHGITHTPMTERLWQGRPMKVRKSSRSYPIWAQARDRARERALGRHLEERGPQQLEALRAARGPAVEAHVPLRPAPAKRAFGAVTAVPPHEASPRRPLQPAQLRQNTLRLSHRTDLRAAASSENRDLGVPGATTPRQPGPRLFGRGRAPFPAPKRRTLSAVREAASGLPRERVGARRDGRRARHAASAELQQRSLQPPPGRLQGPTEAAHTPTLTPGPPPTGTTSTRDPPTRPQSVYSAPRGSPHLPLPNTSTTPESGGLSHATAQQTSFRRRARTPARMRVPILPTAFPPNAPTGDTGS